MCGTSMQLLWKPSRRRYLSTPAASMGTFMVQLVQWPIVLVPAALEVWEPLGLACF